MLNFWKGHKSKILSGLIVLTSLGHGMGYVDDKLYLTLVGLFGGSGLATLRQGIANEVQAVVAKVESVGDKVVAVVPTIVQAVTHRKP